ncbi:MAG: hypothetical protein RR363_04085 [Rikenellaceae bacterium]
MEIKKREIIISVTIILLMIFVGILISSRLSNNIDEKNEIYYKSAKINSVDELLYGMKTNLGNSLVYGDIKVVDDVYLPELVGGYLYIEKSTERYTSHIKTVTHIDSEGLTHKTTKTYHSWDLVGSYKTMSEKITLLGVEIASSKISFHDDKLLELNEKTVNSKYLDRIRGSYIYKYARFPDFEGNIRHSFRIIPSEIRGSIFSKLEDNSINPVNSSQCEFYENKTNSEVIKDKESNKNIPLIIFWIIWAILTGSIVIGFLYLDNRWID